MILTDKTSMLLCHSSHPKTPQDKKSPFCSRVPETLSVSQQDVLRLLPLLGQLLSSAEIGRNIAGRARLDAILKYNNLTPEVVLEQVGQPCSELIERCSWEGREVDCPSVFSRTMTFMGFCCSFNADVDFSVAAQPSRVKREPLKTPYFGYPLGLTVLLHPHTEDYYWGPFVSGGVMCAVHDSNEMATERSPQAMVALGKESMVQMVPRIRNASPSLRDVTPQRRRCLFEDENPTSASDQYSDHMCAIECAAAKLWRTCKCRPLNLPRIRGPRGTLCGLDKLPCLAKFNEEEHDAMVKSQVRGDLLPSSPAEADKLSEEITQMCGCLAQCNSIDYELETTTANFGASRMVRRNFYKDLNATSRCLLHVYYDQQTSTLFINDLVSNTVQLMSSFGGIFSLFLGCSFMSAVEVLYFFTVRLWLLLRGAGMATLTPAQRVDESHPDMCHAPGAGMSFEPRSKSDVWSSGRPIRPSAF